MGVLTPDPPQRPRQPLWDIPRWHSLAADVTHRTALVRGSSSRLGECRHNVFAQQADLLFELG